MNAFIGIGDHCKDNVSGFINDYVCDFPDYAADKLFAPIEKKFWK